MQYPIRIELEYKAGTNEIMMRQVEQTMRQVQATANKYSNMPASKVSSRMLSQLQADANKAAQHMQLTISSAANNVSNSMERMYAKIARFSSVGLAGAAVGLTAVAFSLKRVSEEFMEINEQFEGLEITLKSAFKSVSVAKSLNAEITKMTATSPIPMKDLAELLRSSAVNPFTRSRITEQAAAGTLGSDSGFLHKYVRMTEQMLAFRPDKNVADVVFALREAFSGEFRSLVRRFDIPMNVISAATNTSRDKMKGNSGETFRALQTFFSDIVSDKAVRESLKLPSKLFPNLLEQGVKIPLRQVGDSGSYKKLVDMFWDLYEQIAASTTTKMPAVAKRISESLSILMDSASKTISTYLDKILTAVGSPASVENETIFERIWKTVENALAYLVALLPKVSAGFDRLINGLKQLASFGAGVYNVVASFLSLFSSIYDMVKSIVKLGGAPAIAAMAVMLAKLPSLMGAGVQGLGQLAAGTFTRNSGRSFTSESILAGKLNEINNTLKKNNIPKDYAPLVKATADGNYRVQYYTTKTIGGAAAMGFNAGGPIGGTSGRQTRYYTPQGVEIQKADLGMFPGKTQTISMPSRAQQMGMSAGWALASFASQGASAAKSLASSIATSAAGMGLTMVISMAVEQIFEIATANIQKEVEALEKKIDNVWAQRKSAANSFMSKFSAGRTQGQMSSDVGMLSDRGSVFANDNLLNLLGGINENELTGMGFNVGKKTFFKDYSKYALGGMAAAGDFSSPTYERVTSVKGNETAFKQLADSMAAELATAWSNPSGKMQSIFTGGESTGAEVIAKIDNLIGAFKDMSPSAFMPIGASGRSLQEQTELKKLGEGLKDLLSLDRLTEGSSPINTAKTEVAAVLQKSNSTLWDLTMEYEDSVTDTLFPLRKLSAGFTELAEVTAEYKLKADMVTDSFAEMAESGKGQEFAEKWIRDIETFKKSAQYADLPETDKRDTEELLSALKDGSIWEAQQQKMLSQLETFSRQSFTASAASLIGMVLDKFDAAQKIPGMASIVAKDSMKQFRDMAANPQLSSLMKPEVVDALNNFLTKYSANQVDTEKEKAEFLKERANLYSTLAAATNGMVSRTGGANPGDVFSRQSGIYRAQYTFAEDMASKQRGLDDAGAGISALKALSGFTGGGLSPIELKEFQSDIKKVTGTFEDLQFAAEDLGDSPAFDKLIEQNQKLKKVYENAIPALRERQAAAEAGGNEKLSDLYKDAIPYLEKALIGLAKTINKLNKDSLEAKTTSAVERMMEINSLSGRGAQSDGYRLNRITSGAADIEREYGIKAPDMSFLNTPTQGPGTAGNELSVLAQKADTFIPYGNKLIEQAEKYTATQPELANKLRNTGEAFLKMGEDAKAAFEDIKGGDSIFDSFSKGFADEIVQLKREATNFNDMGKAFARSMKENLGDSFYEIITGAKSAKEAFRDFAASVAKDMMRIATQKLAAGIIGAAFGGFGSGAGGIAGLLTQATAKAEGGIIEGGSGTKDDVLIMAMGGEYVLPKKFVEKIGVHNLDRAVKGYAAGGVVSNPTSGVSSTSSSASGGYNVQFNITTGEKKDDSDHKQMMRELEAAVVQIMSKHAGPGGGLRKMLRA